MRLAMMSQCSCQTPFIRNWDAGTCHDARWRADAKSTAFGPDAQLHSRPNKGVRCWRAAVMLSLQKRRLPTQRVVLTLLRNEMPSKGGPF